jgi:hypothetical protein
VLDLTEDEAEVFRDLLLLRGGNADDEGHPELALEMEKHLGEFVVRVAGGKTLDLTHHVPLAAADQKFAVGNAELDHPGRPVGPHDGEHFRDNDEKAEQEILLPHGESDHRRGDDDGKPIPRHVPRAVLKLRRLPRHFELSHRSIISSHAFHSESDIQRSRKYKVESQK